LEKEGSFEEKYLCEETPKMLSLSSCKSNINDLRSEKHESARVDNKKSNISETVIASILPSVELQEDVKFIASYPSSEREENIMHYVTDNKTNYSANENTQLLDLSPIEQSK